MKKLASLQSMLLLFSSFLLGASSNYLHDPLMGKRSIEKDDLAVGSAEKGTITFYTLKEGSVVPYQTYSDVPFVKWSKLSAGNVDYKGGEELLVGIPKEAKKIESFYKGNIEVIQYEKQRFKRAASYAYKISKYDAIVTAYPRKNHEKALVIRGNAKKDTLEVYDFDSYLLSSIKVGFERYDRLAAGDVDGDGIDEVIFGDASKNRLVVYEILNNKLISKRYITNKRIGIIDREDRLACGDVDGDGKEEIVYFNGKQGKLYFLNEKGAIKKEVKAFKKPGALASGDLDGDGFAEVVWIHPPRNQLIGGHFAPAYNGLRWKKFLVKGAVVGKGDSLAVGNFRNIKLVLGEPIVDEITLQEIPIVVLNDPPKERALFGPPSKALGKFYAAYEHTRTHESSSKVELKSSVSFSRSLKGTKRPASSLFLKKVKYNIENTVTNSIKKGYYKKVVETFGEGLHADGYEDKAVVLRSSYKSFSYPIMAPNNMAVINGKRQYIFVTVPKATVKKIGVIYKSPVHLTGYVASYPRDEGYLYHYSADNVLARGEMVIGCGEMKMHYTKVKQVGSNSESSREVSNNKTEKGRFEIPLYNTVTTYLPVDPVPKSTVKKTSYSFDIQSHEITLTDIDAITIKSLGNWDWCSDPSKRYTVGAVIYTDNKDGHLVIDYYVPEHGSYYKEPPKLKLPDQPLLLDPKTKKPLNFKMNMKLKLR